MRGGHSGMRKEGQLCIIASVTLRSPSKFHLSSKEGLRKIDIVMSIDVISHRDWTLHVFVKMKIPGGCTPGIIFGRGRKRTEIY